MKGTKANEKIRKSLAYLGKMLEIESILIFALYKGIIVDTVIHILQVNPILLLSQICRDGIITTSNPGHR